ncbi:MAG: zinc ABC transporter substrate-binding protein [Bacteroidetes bacterium]|nr:zinc ABC transporter substrate-binding protein [Bacteroidota bacterium]
MKYFFVSLMLLLAAAAQAEVKVVTSLPDLADLARRVGGDRVVVDYIVRGDQNPHALEVKPSYMMKLRSAKLFLIVGMDLELWAQQIVDGSRNDALRVVDLSRRVHKLEVPARVDASQGDVHRLGNPHYWLDPRNVRIMVEDIASALSGISPSDEQYFRANADAYLRQVEQKIVEWEQTMRPFAGRQVIKFHKSWSYLAAWLGLTVADQVEPKPGIAPSPGHTVELIAQVRKAGIKVIIVEPFYDASAAEQIARATGAAVLRLPTSSGVAGEAPDYIGLMEHTITALAGALK